MINESNDGVSAGLADDELQAAAETGVAAAGNTFAGRLADAPEPDVLVFGVCTWANLHLSPYLQRLPCQKRQQAR